MSKIYEALRRHENKTVKAALSGDPLSPSRGPIVRALESIYPLVHRLQKDAGRGVVLHFVAALPGEGASTLSNEFALVASRGGDSRVLLLDADKTQLTTASQFGCDTDLGILDQLQAGKPIEERTVALPDNVGLHVALIAGRRSPPLARKSIPALYDELRAKYDITIIDCPAVLSDRYLALAPEASDGIVLVVQAERNRPEIIRQAQSMVEESGGKFLGAILNRRHTYIPNLIYRLL
jgi:Mrp family chromosome partitioning ATPase